MNLPVDQKEILKLPGEAMTWPLMKWVPSSSIQEDAHVQILEEAKQRIAADPCSIVELVLKGTHLVRAIDIGKTVFIYT